MEAEQLAELFHATYEQLAPEFGYETREGSKGDFTSVPENQRKLMVAVSQTILNRLQTEFNSKTDLDLPEVRRASANLWKARCFEYMREIAKANTGIRRLKRKLDRLTNKETTSGRKNDGD